MKLGFFDPANPPVIGPTPDYPDVYLYGSMMGDIQIWEGDPWIETDKSWFESCYIHAGISGIETTYSGPDAQRLLSETSINDVYKWKIGKCKHLVQLNEEGLIANHALFMRDGEQVFRTTAGTPYPVEKHRLSGSFDVEVTSRPIFIFQFSGPKSLTILEKATQTDLHDVGFLETRMVAIPGIDAEIELCRIGMTGTLAYELRGAKEFGARVYDAVFQVGRPMGLMRLGWRDYAVNHTFGGFPQQNVSFGSCTFADPAFMGDINMYQRTGSIEPENFRARFRTPVEVGWDWMAKFDHDFVGRAALEAEVADPKRTIVSLLWNTDDLVDIYASQFTDDPYKYMEMPCGEQQPAIGHADYIRDAEGNDIGISSDPVYSSWYHVTISHGCIDIDKAELGSEVFVEWGDYGKRIKKVRATIVRYPYIDITRNEDFDTSTVQSGIE